MTTDPYGDAGPETFGPGGQAPVAPGYGISDPFRGAGDDLGAGATATGPVGGSNPGGGTSTTDTAKQEAGQVKDTAADAAQQVAGTAKDEASNVVGEAKAQASNLLDQVKDEAGSQVSTQKDRLAGMAHSYSRELGSMASGSQESGPVTDFVQDLSARVGGAGHWLESHEPVEVLDEVRRFARRRPGAFLLAAVAAGVVVGRLTRGAVDEHRAESDTSSSGSAELTSGAGYPAQPAYAPTYGTQPVAGYGEQVPPASAEQTYVDGSALTDPYAGSTYGSNPGTAS